MADFNQQLNTPNTLERPSFIDQPDHNFGSMSKIRLEILQILQDCLRPHSHHLSPEKAARRLHQVLHDFPERPLTGKRYGVDNETRDKLGGVCVFSIYRLFFEVAKQLPHLPGQRRFQDRLVDLVRNFQGVFPKETQFALKGEDWDLVDGCGLCAPEAYLEEVTKEESLRRLRGHAVAAILTRESLVDQSVLGTNIMGLSLELPSFAQPINPLGREVVLELAVQWIELCGHKFFSEGSEPWQFWMQRFHTLSTLKLERGPQFTDLSKEICKKAINSMRRIEEEVAFERSEATRRQQMLDSGEWYESFHILYPNRKVLVKRNSAEVRAGTRHRRKLCCCIFDCSLSEEDKICVFDGTSIECHFVKPGCQIKMLKARMEGKPAHVVPETCSCGFSDQSTLLGEPGREKGNRELYEEQVEMERLFGLDFQQIM